MNKEILKEIVLHIVLDLAQSIKNHGGMLNERYLHHDFTHQLQNKYDLLNLTNEKTKIILHPEWPTYKKQTDLKYGRYKKNKETKQYLPDEKGTAGFIDFAIGDYKAPYIGIEFLMSFGWSSEDAIFDFIKLLDKQNPFGVAISLIVILRDNKLTKNKDLENLEKAMNMAYEEALSRLGDNACDASRELYFIVVEIDKNNKRQFWHLERNNNAFIKELLKL